MAQRERSSQKSISNLSVNFIESAFLILVENSLPVYRHSIDRKRPPVAAGENVSAAAAVMLLATGLDYHLCRLKYLRDVAKHTPALPHTPYFNWSFADALSVKIQRLLLSPRESRLQRQVIEFTVCRDAIIHPKFYTITHSWAGVDFKDGTVTAELPPGVDHRPKTIQHKMQRREFSRILKLPLVPTWVSYVDARVRFSLRRL
jgi:predicted secreted protein